MMRVLVFLLSGLSFSSFGAHAELSNVIPFRPKRPGSACESNLRAGPARVIAFPSATPEYQTLAEFLQSEPSDIFFFEAGAAGDPFADRTSKTWAIMPFIPAGEWLYILKAKSRSSDPLVAPQDRRLNLHEINGQYRVQNFTKIRIPRAFRIVCRLINEVRGLESHERQESFEAIELDYSSLLNPKLNAYALGDIVNSWKVKTPYEGRIKDLIKEWLAQTGISSDDHRDCRNLSLQLIPSVRTAFENTQIASSVLSPILNECL
jgi:hypothetical protein